MKKFLSLMLTLALIITTLALPITASAADISLQALVEGKTITVSYTPSASTVHPGETFTIGVKATPSADITLDSYVVDINYDGTQFTLNNEETADLKKFDSNTTNAYVRLISETKDQSVTAADGLNLVTLNFTVKDTAVATSYTTCILGDDTAFNVKNGSTIDWFVLGSNITDDKVITTVAENTYSVKIDGNELVPGKTYYKTSGVTVSVTGTGIESVKVNEESLTADGAYTKVLTEGGEYTVKVKVIGKSEESKSFTLNTETIAAKLITDFAAVETGYTRGGTFEVPVKITGLGTSAQAAMVSFKVEAAAGLTLDTTALGTGVTYDAENKTVMYGNTAGETGLGNDALVATLKFNVEDAAVYGVNSVTISDAKLALVKDIDPTADSIGNEINTQKVVVVPTAAFGTLPANIITEAWKNTAYTVAVTPADDAVSVKYLAVGELTNVETTTQSGLKAIYDNAQAVANATVTVDSENNYVIVARVGDDTNAVYELVGTLTPGTNAWYDATAPTVNITGIAPVTGVKSSKGGYVFNITGLAKSDARSGLDKIEYSLNGVDYTVFGLEDTSITIPEKNFNGNVTFKVTDKAGNTAVSDGFALKLDMDDPTVTGMAVSAVKADASKDITANVTDVGSGVTNGAITVAVYKGDAGSAALSDISAIEVLEKVADATLNEGVATYNTTTAGRYYFVAADAAGHKAFASVDVAFATLSEASGIKVKVYAKATDYVAGFKTTADADLADFEETNGSFRYVAIKADAAATGYSNSLTLAKDGAEATAYTEETPITEAGNYVLTVTTTHRVNAADTESATYKFSIVDELNMPSPNADMRFNIIDFAMVRQLVDLGKALPTAENGFSGGIFSGDVTGDLTVNTADYADIIRSVRAGEKPGAYTFNVFNK